MARSKPTAMVVAMTRVVVSLIASLLLVTACSKDETPPETIPFDPAPVQTVAEEPRLEDSPTDTSSAEPTSGSGDAPTSAKQPPTQAANRPKPKGGGSGASISSCCAALGAQARSARDLNVRNRAKQASGVCYNIDKVVRSGRTSRTSALRQVRAVAGAKAPAACR